MIEEWFGEGGEGKHISLIGYAFPPPHSPKAVFNGGESF